MIEEENIDRIVQLDIEVEGLTEEELEEFGVEIVSLVDEPAIGVDFMAFEAEDGTIELESYTDYPKAASRNAQRALDWAEENGWGSCGTAVGKRRANQLAKRQPISEETIARMSAFRRQEGNKNTPYGEGCGGLMWDAWGGDEGIAWAAKKLERIRREKDEASYHSGSIHFTEEQEDAIIAFATDAGYELTADDVIIDLNNKEFANVTETVEAIRGLDLLKRLEVQQMTPLTYWRYTGPPAQRKFCKAMVNLSKAGKIFSQADIDKMDSLNSQFAKSGQSSYSIFRYKGGKNCKHYWEKLSVFENTLGQRVVIAGQATNRTQDKAVTPWANLSSERHMFSIDEDKRIVTGPLMIPNKMILRRDSEGNPYYIFFTKATIQKMMEKFLRLNKHNNTDVQHDNKVTTQNTLLESWISEDKMYDKAYKLGYALPMGTWYVSYKINDDKTWEKVKSGELKGFSLAGPFIEKMASENNYNQQLSKIIDILNQVEDVEE